MHTESPTSPATRIRISWTATLLVIFLVLTAIGGVATLVFIQRLDGMLGDLRHSRSMGSCTAPTRTVDEYSGFMARMTFSYPCGWHVLESPLVRDRGPIISDFIAVNPSPITLAPRDVEPGRIMIRVDEQDNTQTLPMLPALEKYLADTREGAWDLVETRVTNSAGIEFTKISSTRELMGFDAYYENYFTEWMDPAQPKRRMVIIISSGNPAFEKDGSVTQALELIVNTMKPL